MGKIKKILLLVLCFIVFCGCSNKAQKVENEDVSLDKILEKNNYIIVDVRTKEEYSEGHVSGAINIPYDEIDENVNLDKNKDILVYCRSGARSSIANNILTNLGYKVYDLGEYAKIDLEKE